MNKKNIPGQTLIEFALLFPIVIFLVLGLFDLGRAIFYYSALNTAVRQGTRYAIVQPDCDYKTDPVTCSGGYVDTYPLNCNSAGSKANIDICSEITDHFYNLSELSSSTILIEHPDTTTEDPKVQISIDYLFTPITPGITLFGEINLRVNSVMMISPIALP